MCCTAFSFIITTFTRESFRAFTFSRTTRTSFNYGAVISLSAASIFFKNGAGGLLRHATGSLSYGAARSAAVTAIPGLQDLTPFGSALRTHRRTGAGPCFLIGQLSSGDDVLHKAIFSWFIRSIGVLACGVVAQITDLLRTTEGHSPIETYFRLLISVLAVERS